MIFSCFAFINSAENVILQEEFMSNDLERSTFLFANNCDFIEALHKKYITDPSSVDESWSVYFKGFQTDEQSMLKIISGKQPKALDIRSHRSTKTSNAIANVAAHSIVDAYRRYGHTAVKLDPLGIAEANPHVALSLAQYGLNEASNESVSTSGALGLPETSHVMTVISTAQKIYASDIGADFMYIENQKEKDWIINKLESPHRSQISVEEKKRILQDLLEVTNFENFLHKRFPGTKRFSVEGGEASVIATESVISTSASLGIDEAVIGMAHRGRLNTLTKILKKPYHAMFSEFSGNLAFPDDIELPGDVKYHLGASTTRDINGQSVHLSLTPNPSHLEAVNSVVLGRVRAKQDHKGDKERKKVMAILIHGDAAFAGQGCVSESLISSLLEGYAVGGTMHIVVNNQIGFTAIPSETRGGRYCTDLAKAIDAPIFHVNGDNIEAVVAVSKLASDYRHQFGKDVVIDIVCYRKYGHNEGDEPMFTQPKMYTVIKHHPDPVAIYSQKLIAEGTITESEHEAQKAAFQNLLTDEFNASQNYKPKKADWFEGIWKTFTPPTAATQQTINTGLSIDTLKDLGRAMIALPEGFNLHTTIARQFDVKSKMMETGGNIDWAMGEGLAFASLLNEGFDVRITGQDSERGTFSHRHAVLRDQITQVKHNVFNHLNPEQKNFLEIHNSNLSEFAVLAFEYGYSFSSPQALVIWEAQFGDFANGAQTIIDQFIAVGEAKWLRSNGLVMLLPHGYEGGGPEHSSARLERFLQLCGNDNMQVVNCSTPASFFHVLRRQLHRNYRKPLIVMSPKSLLRHKLAISSLSEMGPSTSFLPILPDTLINNSKSVKKLILCSGKVYYDLYEERAKLNKKDIALVRFEQLYPFPKAEFVAELRKYPSAHVVWCQEEHENMGAYSFIQPLINKALEESSHSATKLSYIGRREAATTAVGYMKLHVKEQSKIMEQIFNG